MVDPMGVEPTFCLIKSQEQRHILLQINLKNCAPGRIWTYDGVLPRRIKSPDRSTAAGTGAIKFLLQEVDLNHWLLAFTPITLPDWVILRNINELSYAFSKMLEFIITINFVAQSRLELEV